RNAERNNAASAAQSADKEDGAENDRPEQSFASGGGQRRDGRGGANIAGISGDSRRGAGHGGGGRNEKPRYQQDRGGDGRGNERQSGGGGHGGRQQYAGGGQGGGRKFPRGQRGPGGQGYKGGPG